MNLQHYDALNTTFKLAADLVDNTSRDIFLTGKAGTGKTTFLKYIRENTWKNVVVAAPTGVAAINAGGVTLHSLFQLPLQPYLPNNTTYDSKKFFRMGQAKISLLRNLDLLIIDEVSMLRSDLLDAIDQTLRRYRRNNYPFGGVQVLYIGDMFQLPPVVKEDEWEFLKNYYQSSFFFHAKVIEKQSPLYIELKTVYRQRDEHFIDILNHLRHNELQLSDLETLNAHYNPHFQLSQHKGYIALCTHNYKADRLNNEELERLKGKSHVFKGIIVGEFLESALPTEMELVLKVGAQVMFIRNDTGEDRRYYNGKLATVSKINDEGIFVKLADSEMEIQIHQEAWENIRYSFNKESGTIEEELLGSFTQYPIRLAWAITIHKSQGLTFDKVVIDAGQSFAAGQVYVALSRCTSLEGIVLLSKISDNIIYTDQHILDFTQKETNTDTLHDILITEKPVFLAQCLSASFDWNPLIQGLYNFKNLINEKQTAKHGEAEKLIQQMLIKAHEQKEVVLKFKVQLQQILDNIHLNNALDILKERVQKAVSYFYEAIYRDILLPWEEHLSSLESATKVKQYIKEAKAIQDDIIHFAEALRYIHYGDMDLIGNAIESKKISLNTQNQEKTSKVGKTQKGDSAKITFDLFKAGKTIEQIAQERNLVITTIEGHLCKFITQGKLSVFELLDKEKVNKILMAIEQSESRSLSSIKEQLGEFYSYAELRMVKEHYLLQQKETKKAEN